MVPWIVHRPHGLAALKKQSADFRSTLKVSREPELGQFSPWALLALPSVPPRGTSGWYIVVGTTRGRSLMKARYARPIRPGCCCLSKHFRHLVPGLQRVVYKIQFLVAKQCKEHPVCICTELGMLSMSRSWHPFLTERALACFWGVGAGTVPRLWLVTIAPARGSVDFLTCLSAPDCQARCFTMTIISETLASPEKERHASERCLIPALAPAYHGI